MAGLSYLFFFNDTATTEIYTLSLHDALPIFLRDEHRGRSEHCRLCIQPGGRRICVGCRGGMGKRHDWIARVGTGLGAMFSNRSEEHTSELQSHLNLVCRLLLEKKNSTTAAED